MTIERLPIFGMGTEHPPQPEIPGDSTGIGLATLGQVDGVDLARVDPH